MKMQKKFGVMCKRQNHHGKVALAEEIPPYHRFPKPVEIRIKVIFKYTAISNCAWKLRD